MKLPGDPTTLKGNAHSEGGENGQKSDQLHPEKRTCTLQKRWVETKMRSESWEGVEGSRCRRELKTLWSKSGSFS